ncbi:hypothetical protein [Persicitalea sp.]|uniref:hypothetical protein n=1 Tax=Persicitalea sp. TaxID=3100273 RepID=UPI0035940A30
MLSNHFRQIAEAIHAGHNASEQLRSRYVGYLAEIAKNWDEKQNSAKATARRAIVMLESRIKKDKEQTVSRWPEEKVKSTLLEYLEQQRILKKIRATKTLADFPTEVYFGLETTLLYRIDYHKKQGSIPADDSPELWWLEAQDKTIAIFLEKIQAPGFVLTASFSAYLSGIARRVVDQMVSEKYAVQNRRSTEEFEPEDLDDDRRTHFFSTIDDELSQLKNPKCRSLLRSIVNLFESIAQKEKIEYSEIVSLRKVAIQELENLRDWKVKEIDKSFENCRKRFVVESFPKIQAQYGDASPFSPEFIAQLVRRDQQKLEEERKNKRNWKAEKSKAKKETGDGID